VFFEEGEPLVDGAPGDLKFVVRAVPTRGWERRGHDLVINHTITLVDALTGAWWWGCADKDFVWAGRRGSSTDVTG
jgi:hypothetical protein